MIRALVTSTRTCVTISFWPPQLPLKIYSKSLLEINWNLVFLLALGSKIHGLVSKFSSLSLSRNLLQIWFDSFSFRVRHLTNLIQLKVSWCHLWVTCKNSFSNKKCNRTLIDTPKEIIFVITTPLGELRLSHSGSYRIFL